MTSASVKPAKRWTARTDRRRTRLWGSSHSYFLSTPLLCVMLLCVAVFWTSGAESRRLLYALGRALKRGCGGNSIRTGTSDTVSVNKQRQLLRQQAALTKKTDSGLQTSAALRADPMRKQNPHDVWSGDVCAHFFRSVTWPDGEKKRMHADDERLLKEVCRKKPGQQRHYYKRYHSYYKQSSNTWTCTSVDQRPRVRLQPPSTSRRRPRHSAVVLFAGNDFAPHTQTSIPTKPNEQREAGASWWITPLNPERKNDDKSTRNAGCRKHSKRRSIIPTVGAIRPASGGDVRSVRRQKRSSEPLYFTCKLSSASVFCFFSLFVAATPSSSSSSPRTIDSVFGLFGLDISLLSRPGSRQLCKRRGSASVVLSSHKTELNKKRRRGHAAVDIGRQTVRRPANEKVLRKAAEELLTDGKEEVLLPGGAEGEEVFTLAEPDDDTEGTKDEGEKGEDADERSYFSLSRGEQWEESDGDVGGEHFAVLDSWPSRQSLRTSTPTEVLLLQPASRRQQTLSSAAASSSASSSSFSHSLPFWFNTNTLERCFRLLARCCRLSNAFSVGRWVACRLLPGVWRSKFRVQDAITDPAAEELTLQQPSGSRQSGLDKKALRDPTSSPAERNDSLKQTRPSTSLKGEIQQDRWLPVPLLPRLAVMAFWSFLIGRRRFLLPARNAKSTSSAALLPSTRGRTFSVLLWAENCLTRLVAKPEEPLVVRHVQRKQESTS